MIDLTNPAAVDWWRQRIDRGLDMGAEGFMLDFGEQVLPGMHFHDGSTGVRMHNEYPVLVQRITSQIVKEYEALHPGRQIVFFTRSGYSATEGSPGSPAYESFNFPGDETTDWSHASGIASLTSDMLNRAIGGAYGYGSDIGGYYDLFTPSDSRRAVRALGRVGALTPVFRVHGATPASSLAPRRLNSTGLWRRLSALHQERRAADPLALGREPTGPASRRRVPCISNIRRTGSRRRRIRSGCSARMSSWPPSWNASGEAARCTSRRAAGAIPKPGSDRTAGRGGRARGEKPASVLLPLWHGAVLAARSASAAPSGRGSDGGAIIRAWEPASGRIRRTSATT